MDLRIIQIKYTEIYAWVFGIDNNSSKLRKKNSGHWVMRIYIDQNKVCENALPEVKETDAWCVGNSYKTIIVRLISDSYDKKYLRCDGHLLVVNQTISLGDTGERCG